MLLLLLFASDNSRETARLPAPERAGVEPVARGAAHHSDLRGHPATASVPAGSGGPAAGPELHGRHLRPDWGRPAVTKYRPVQASQIHHQKPIRR